MNALGFRSLQAALAVSAVVLLTGAKGQGCGEGTVEPQPYPVPVDPPAACSPGWHLGTVCTSDPEPVPMPVEGPATSVDGSDANAAIGAVEPPAPEPECHDECVPDGPCPDGFAQQWVCSGGGGVPLGAPEDDMPVCDGEGCPPPPSCELQCVPAECPKGSHAEFSCTGATGGGVAEAGQVVGVGEADGMDGQAGVSTKCAPSPEPMPPDACVMSCVPDSACPVGTIEETVCSNVACGPGEGCAPSEPVCTTECVPEQSPPAESPSEPAPDAP